jgi:hypothetical protein
MPMTRIDGLRQRITEREQQRARRQDAIGQKPPTGQPLNFVGDCLSAESHN